MPPAGTLTGGAAAVGSGVQPEADEAAATELPQDVQPDSQVPALRLPTLIKQQQQHLVQQQQCHGKLSTASVHRAFGSASATDFKDLSMQQQHQPQPGAETAALMPVLAARCPLLLGCVIFSMAAGEAAAATSGGRSPHLTQPLLLPAVAAAQQMTALAADLAESLPQPDEQPMQWLLQCLLPLQKQLTALLPASLPACPA